MVLDAKDDDVLRSEKLVASRIAGFNVVGSIKLDRESRLRTVEVEDERRERILPMKLETELFAADQLPEHSLF